MVVVAHRQLQVVVVPLVVGVVLRAVAGGGALVLPKELLQNVRQGVRLEENESVSYMMALGPTPLPFPSALVLTSAVGPTPLPFPPAAGEGEDLAMHRQHSGAASEHAWL